MKNKIQQIISYNFGIPVNKLYLTHPTFFSEMTTKSAKTTHDEYWHVHVDKVHFIFFLSMFILSNFSVYKLMIAQI